MNSTLLPLRLKIITGYVTLVLLFLILLTLIYCENRRMSAIDKRSEIALAQREQVESITLQILDIALLSEHVTAWNEADIAAFLRKRKRVTSLLQGFQQQLMEENQRKRIASILTLLSTKEKQTLAIVNDLRELRTANELLNKRLPGIIWQTKQDRQRLAEQIEDNYRKSEKKNSGLLGLFRNKEKSRNMVKEENKDILRRDDIRSGILLRSLAKEIQFTHDKKSARLFARMDSLSHQNAYLNNEISRLVTEVSNTEQAQLKEKAATYLLGREKSLRLVSGLGISTALLALVFYLILHRDLKNRYFRRMQLELLNCRNEELLHSRKNMMLTVSHDLRAPLTAIRGCTELLINERHKDKRAELCDTIMRSSDSMTALLNALLNFHRLDTGKELPNHAPFRLKSLVETLSSEFLPIANKVGLSFTVEYCEGDIVVVGDRERLTQIARNLLSNAIKFTTEGEIQLKLCYKIETLAIEVSDTGTGMMPEQIKRIFQPFERLENAETRDGFGLGLAITQGLTGLLNGSIEVDSQIGKGSTFTIRIPLPVTEEQHLKKASISSYNLPAGLKILAIDDDAVLLKMTGDMLTRNRVRCDTCQDVQELTTRMREQKYDLLITDIRMPKISGYDLLELLRSSDIGTSRTIPVLALTARADCQEDDFIALGFAGCLYKPFSIAELLLAVQSSIEMPKEEYPLQADFTELLSGEQNNIGMLELLILETEKDMEALKESMEKENRHAMLELIHHLLPLWEIVRINSPLEELCRILTDNSVVSGKEVLFAVNGVIAAGNQLTIQASRKIKEEGYV